MKRFFAVLMLLSMTLFTLAGCGQHKSAATDAQLKSVLTKYTKQQILFFQSIDIGNSQNAAFAIVVGQPSYNGDVWYISASGAQKLKENIRFPDGKKPDTPYIWTVDKIKMFKCESDSGGSSSSSFAWYIKNGKPVELLHTGMGLNYNGNGRFTTIGSDFDYNFTDGLGTGHTYKCYYLYWEANGLKEYGGLKITQQQLLKIDGAQMVIDAITKSGHTIDEIYYRSNNIININYHSGDKNNRNFDNVTLIYKNSKVTPELVYTDSSSKIESLNDRNLKDFSFGGIYKVALFSEIATYPNQFPIN